MTTIATEVAQAAAGGIAGLFTGGSLRLDTSADAELAVLPVASVGSASNANPSAAVLSMTADTSVTAGTIAKFILRTSGAAARLNGTVSTIAAGTGDLQFTDTVVPSGATEVSMSSGFTLSLEIIG